MNRYGFVIYTISKVKERVGIVMNVISNRELHLKKFERRLEKIGEKESYPKHYRDTTTILSFDKCRKKKSLDVRVEAL